MNREVEKHLTERVLANNIPIDAVYWFDIVNKGKLLLRDYRPALQDKTQWGQLEFENPLSTTE